MNHPAPSLDDVTWTKYMNRLRSHRVPVDDLKSPGLDDAEMDEMTAVIGLTLPDEARVLWRSHDGVPEDGCANPIGAFRKRFLGLAEAVEVYRGFRETTLKGGRGRP